MIFYFFICFYFNYPVLKSYDLIFYLVEPFATFAIHRLHLYQKVKENLKNSKHKKKKYLQMLRS